MPWTAGTVQASHVSSLSFWSSSRIPAVVRVLIFRVVAPARVVPVVFVMIFASVVAGLLAIRSRGGSSDRVSSSIYPPHEASLRMWGIKVVVLSLSS